MLHNDVVLPMIKTLYVLLCLLLISACSEKLPQLDIPGVRVLDQAIALDAFTLQDYKNQEFSNKHLRGKWTLAFFGYTHCPDICPNTMLVMNMVHKKLSANPAYQDTRYLFVSVDPHRDTAEKLKNFITYFNDEFLAVTGQITELKNMTGLLGAAFDYSNPESDEIYRDTSKVPPIKNYVVNHAASIYLFDNKGRVVAYIAPPHDVNKVAEVYTKLRS